MDELHCSPTRGNQLRLSSNSCGIGPRPVQIPRVPTGRAQGTKTPGPTCGKSTCAVDSVDSLPRQGAHGALAATPGGTTHAVAFPVKVKDTLGAGDAFDGGFIAAQLAGMPVEAALRWGNAVAALKIGQPGARGLPLRDEVEQFLVAQPAG